MIDSRVLRVIVIVYAPRYQLAPPPPPKPPPNGPTPLDHPLHPPPPQNRRRRPPPMRPTIMKTMMTRRIIQNGIGVPPPDAGRLTSDRGARTPAIVTLRPWAMRPTTRSVPATSPGP